MRRSVKRASPADGIGPGKCRAGRVRFSLPHRNHRSAAVPRAAVSVSVSFVSSGGGRNEMNEPSLVNESLLTQRLTDLEVARSWAPDVLAGLEHFIRTADDYDLFRVNPLQYAGASR